MSMLRETHKEHDRPAQNIQHTQGCRRPQTFLRIQHNQETKTCLLRHLFNFTSCFLRSYRRNDDVLLWQDDDVEPL